MTIVWIFVALIIAILAVLLPPLVKNADSAKERYGLLVLALGIPLIAGSLYMHLGAPELAMMDAEHAPDTMTAQASDHNPDSGHGSDLAAMVDQLQTRLADKGSMTDDQYIDGLMLLGRSQITLGRYDAAIQSFTRAAELTNNHPEVLSSLGEAIVFAAGGQVPPGARHIFEQVIATTPDNPAAQYYLGLADAQQGNIDKARTEWEALAKNSPEDAPWVASLHSQIAMLDEPAPTEAPMNLHPASASKGPTRQDVDAAAQMSAKDRQEMIQSMVESLHQRLLTETPDDVEGWIKLARSYAVLGAKDKAEDALQHAEALQPNHPQIKIIRQTMLQ